MIYCLSGSGKGMMYGYYLPVSWCVCVYIYIYIYVCVCVCVCMFMVNCLSRRDSVTVVAIW